MKTLTRIVRNEYFPAAAVLVSVVLFWAAGLLGGLSLLRTGQPPLGTLLWLLFVYAATVLSPLAGLLAIIDLLHRRARKRRRPVAFYNLSSLGQGAAEAAGSATRGGKAGP